MILYICYIIMILLQSSTLIFIFHADVVALGRSYFGSGSGAIYLDSVVCNGSERTLQQCAANPNGVHNCDHSEDAGVKCGGTFVLFPNMYYLVYHFFQWQKWNHFIVVHDHYNINYLCCVAILFLVNCGFLISCKVLIPLANYNY